MRTVAIALPKTVGPERESERESDSKEKNGKVVMMVDGPNLSFMLRGLRNESHPRIDFEKIGRILGITDKSLKVFFTSLPQFEEKWRLERKRGILGFVRKLKTKRWKVKIKRIQDTGPQGRGNVARMMIEEMRAIEEGERIILLTGDSFAIEEIVKIAHAKKMKVTLVATKEFLSEDSLFLLKEDEGDKFIDLRNILPELILDNRGE
jgi:TusA-related sulfurtransferase